MNPDSSPLPGARADSAAAKEGESASPPLKVVEVAAGLVFRNGLLLLTQRHDNAHLGGLWEFPGGKRLPGETYEACLHRELREELQIEVEIRELVETITHEYPEMAVHLRFFRCIWKCHEPRAIGCQDFVWTGQAQLSKYAFPAADQQLLEKLTNSPELWR